MDRYKIGNNSFSTENMEEYVKKCNDQKELLPIYMDHIRNGRLLSEQMLENIEKFDASSKMKLIIEYNRCMKILIDTLQ